MEEINLLKFKNFNLNNYIGNYKDIINNKNVFIIPKKNDNNILYLFNLYNKYFLELNLLLKKCSYFSIPFFNDKYDPFNFKLSGWSEHMSVECDSYEDVLEQLYEIFQKGKVDKEL